MSIFHKFIETSAQKPIQTNLFSEFAFMQHEIRKSYKQVKDSKGQFRQNDDFVTYWKQLGRQGKEQQVALYFRWVGLLQQALQGVISGQLLDRDAQLYVRKGVLGKWERRRVRLSQLNLLVFSKRLKEYPLRYFCIRKSKNKEHFSWVMEVVMQPGQDKYKSFHIGTNNIVEFQEWFRELEVRIDIARIQYFREKVNDGGEKKGDKKIQRQKEVDLGSKTKKMRTITELVMDKQMNKIQDFQGLEVIEESQFVDFKQEELHPNIFGKLFPGEKLEGFADPPMEATLVTCDKQHRLFEVPKAGGKIIQMKLMAWLGHNQSNVFRAISQSPKHWNPQIQVFTIKNKISSQNSILIYQKDRAPGFLYRQRDYLYLRHCFTVQPSSSSQRKQIIMIEKSIDSIHTPPFMTVARGEKQLVWCIVGAPEEKQCLLVVQGLIRGGGYMKAAEDRELTVRHFRQVLQLDGYLRQVEYSRQSKQGFLFHQNWLVRVRDKNDDDQQFYSPHKFGSEEDNSQRSSNSARKNPPQHEQQYQQFIRNTSQQLGQFQGKREDFRLHEQKSPMKQFEKKMIEEVSFNINEGQVVSDFKFEMEAPALRADQTVIIPLAYLKAKHLLNPRAKGSRSRFYPRIRGHHLWKGEWAISQAGGLNYVDEDKMNQQKKVLTFIIKRIGKNILTGKGILNISLPVDIFCRQSNIQRLAMSFGYCPKYLEDVVNSKDPVQQLKAVVASAMGSSLIYLTMEKPFNPILGETYQCWIDGCPVYFQQVSHHPPIAAYFMKGRGYTISGTVEAKMDLSINSGTGNNEGIFTVRFDNGRIFHFTTAPGQLSGLTYGERKLLFVDRTYFWNMEQGIFMQVQYNVISKLKGFFGGGAKNLTGDERLADYFEGLLRRYRPEDLREHLTPKKNDFRKIMAIPRSSPSCQPLQQLGKLWGRWTKYVMLGEEKIFDVDEDVYYAAFDEPNPLPSHSNYRQDIFYRRLNNFVLSQDFKEVLEVKQRKDRKLKEQYAKKKVK